MEYKEIIEYILYTATTVLLPIAGGYLISLLKTKIKNVKTITSNEAVDKAIKEAAEIVLDAVICVNQTYVESLKKSGNFTKEAQLTAKSKALAKAVTLLSTESKDIIVSVYSSLEDWLDTQIEKSVQEIKTKKN